MQYTNFPIPCSPYGNSGTRKSSQIAEFIKLNYKATGRKARLLNADDGGISAYRSLIAAGVIDLVDISQPPWSLAAPQTWFPKIAKGLWPLKNPKTGKIELIDGQADPAYDTLVVEGLDSGASKMGSDFIAKGTKVNQDVVAQISEKAIDGSSVLSGALSMAHYGAIQNIITQMFLPFVWSLKYDHIFVTTHEGMGEDKIGLDGKVYGPAIIGKALVPKIAAQIPILLHFDSIAEKPKADANGKFTDLSAKISCRGYFTQHQDLGNPTAKAIWPANSRIPQSQWLSLLERYPEGFISLDKPSALYDFFQVWRELCQRDLDELASLAPAQVAPATPAATTPNPQPKP